MVATADRQFLGNVRSAALDIGVVVGLLGFLAFMVLTGRPGQLGELIQEYMRSSFGFFVSLQFMLAVPTIFILEYIIPARPDQRGVGPNVVMDALYMLIHLPVFSAFMVFISGPISDYLAANASWAVVDTTREWPLWLAALVGLMIADFGAWIAHLLKHKVSWIWRFHMIHHSQPRMSMFTANRTHPIDALFESFLLLLPFFFLFPSITEKAGAVFLLGLLPGWYVRFQHANIRTNMGPVRYFFVTPQSHRVHHSTEPEHWNSNYANIFAWDRLFGTQHPDDTSYPPTGINDPYFPEPTRFGVAEFASSFVGQMLFPFDSEAVARASTGSPYDDSPDGVYGARPGSGSGSTTYP
ncbi:MAG: sterol desaturase family protein [Acidimicrobiia bacterium]|nr:sterol desaturase family protein [Acidimicrobiia bacterium]